MRCAIAQIGVYVHINAFPFDLKSKSMPPKACLSPILQKLNHYG